MSKEYAETNENKPSRQTQSREWHLSDTPVTQHRLCTCMNLIDFVSCPLNLQPPLSLPLDLHLLFFAALSKICIVSQVTMIGSFLSALVGFAFALTTTSLLSNLIGSKTAQPLVAILFFVNQVSVFAAALEHII